MEGYNFEGKRALVTGAGKGIGRGITIELAKLGAQVVAISRTQSDLDSLKLEVPGKIETVLLDVADWDNTRQVVENIGAIYKLVNNAGILKAGTFLEATKEDLDSMIDIIFRAAFNIAQVVARGMVTCGTGGAIVNVSSLAGRRAAYEHAAYGTTKGAMDVLTQNMANELGQFKIRTNSVNPTLVITDMANIVFADPAKRKILADRIPLKQIVEVEHVVNAVMFLLSDKASMINGTLLPVDGGVMTACI